MDSKLILRLLSVLTITLIVTLGSPILKGASPDYGGYRPHFQGFGVETTGGRGGSVCKVTSLSDSAWPPVPGTLRHCVESSSGPRFVVFETSGTVALHQGPLFVRNPFITIAGQTAPSPGIVIRGPGLIIDTHDVVVQHVRVRVGNLSGQPIALWVRDDATRVVLDHVSASWSIWTALVFASQNGGHPVGEVTVIDSIVSEALACSGVNETVPCDPDSRPRQGWTNSRGVRVGDGWGHAQPKVTMLRNIMAQINDRFPESNGGTQTLFVNNLLYNPSQTPLSAIFFQDYHNQGPTLSVVQGNVMIPGPTTPGHNGYVDPEYPQEGDVMLVRISPTTHAGSKIYMADNYYAKDCGGTACLANLASQWMLAKDQKMEFEGVNIRAMTPPISVASLPLSSTLPYAQVESYTTANAGARPLDRDAVDARIINEIATRTGFVPNRTSDVAGPGTTPDGFPIMAVNHRPLTVPANPNEVVDSVGRTRIEQWLEAMARELEPGGDAGKDGLSAPKNLRFGSY